MGELKRALSLKLMLWFMLKLPLMSYVTLVKSQSFKNSISHIKWK